MPISNVSLSIEAIAKPELYPNPSDGKFVLGTNSLVPFSVIIYNTLGKKVLEADWVGKKEFDLNLKSGVYFLHLNFYSSMEVLKLIIHRVD